MKYHHWLLAGLLLFRAGSAEAATLQWTNPLGGSWFVHTNWSPAAVPGPGDTALITNAGTYTVFIPTGAVAVATLQLGGGAGGMQTLIQGSTSVLNMTNAGTVGPNGVLLVTNQGLRGVLTVQAGGQLIFTNSANKQLYSLALVNEGTVTWADGSLSVGGSSGETTTISNGGLWEITGNTDMGYGGGTFPIWQNAGTVRKSGGPGGSGISGVNFVNQPGGLVEVLSGILNFAGANTNPVSGMFLATTPGTIRINNGFWTDAGGTFSGTGTNQFNSGTLLLRTNVIAGLKLLGGDLYITGTNTFQETGTITNLTLDGMTLRGTNQVNHGTLTINSGNLPGRTTILPAGQLVFGTATSKLLYDGSIYNQGTVTLAAGGLSVGGTPGTVISNGGLWQIAGDLNLSYGGGQVPVWINTGVLRKTTGSGVAQVGMKFINQPGALVESLAGLLRFGGGDTSEYGGTFNAVLPGSIDIFSGTWTDAGGIATGTGTNRLSGGTLNLRTNTIPGLRLLGGEIFITGTNTFQQAGVITNLTLDGTVLRGTNRLDNGTLTNNASAMLDSLTILPGGTLVLAAASKNLYKASIFNQGTVLWTGGGVNVGDNPPTLVSNGGLWQISGDVVASFGGGLPAVWTNSGTLRRTTSSGIASIAGFNFYNQTSGLVQVDTGTLQLSSVTTNQAGTLRLNGGALTANPALAFSGGTLEGTGLLGANVLRGGTITPGQGGAGRITFMAGLNLGSNVVLSLDGTGTVPGTQYDQLSVTGTVALSNCTLQITSWPNVTPGTTFMIITNDGTDAVGGTFAGLPEGELLNVGPQMFRIYYTGGSGNDVTLVRATGPAVLTPTKGFTNGNWFFTGLGTPAGIVYTIQATTNFTNWSNIGTVTGSGGGAFTFTDTNAFLFKQRFYRTTN